MIHITFSGDTATVVDKSMRLYLGAALFYAGIVGLLLAAFGVGPLIEPSLKYSKYYLYTAPLLLCAIFFAVKAETWGMVVTTKFSKGVSQCAIERKGLTGKRHCRGIIDADSHVVITPASFADLVLQDGKRVRLAWVNDEKDARENLAEFFRFLSPIVPEMKIIGKRSVS